MSTNWSEYIAELNQNYNDLGEDLLMLEAILLASEGETGFPGEYAVSSMQRIRDYIRQHMGDIKQMTEYLITAPRRNAPRDRAC